VREQSKQSGLGWFEDVPPSSTWQSPAAAAEKWEKKKKRSKKRDEPKYATLVLQVAPVRIFNTKRQVRQTCSAIAV
jgi:hypothetical protein